MPDPAADDTTAQERRAWREPALHGAAAAGGAALAAVSLGSWSVELLVRTGALGVALSLVGAGLVRAVALGRSEWRREDPRPALYALIVARFVAAFLLVVTATT